MATEDDEEWMQMNDTNWRGLGLTDPVKKVEVSRRNIVAQHLTSSYRTNGCCYLRFLESRVW
jgi:hypothetical protein